MSRLLSHTRIAALSLIAVPWFASPPAFAEQAESRILILNSYNYTFPAATAAATGARDRLQQRSPRKIEVDAEYLDMVRFPDPGHERLMADFLRDRYAQRQPNIVLVIGADSLPFVVKHRDSFAPGVPVVFLGVGKESLERIQRPPDVTGHRFDLELNLTETLALAERLQPNARKLFAIAGSGRLDRRWQAIARDVISRRERKFETTYLFDLTYDALAAEVARIPSDAIVLCLSVFRDANGQDFIPAEIANKLAALSPAPFYTPYIDQIGRGLLGGFSETFAAMGGAGADIALEILSGKDPATVPPRPNPRAWYQVDHRAMQRWKLNEANLPPDTVILNKPPSLWEEHRDLVLAALLAFALQTAFVVALLIQRRRRQRAERLLKESEERMTFTAASVNVGLWQLDRTTNALWATEHCRALLGLSKDVALSRDTILEAIHPEDREAAASAIRSIIKTGDATAQDLRFVRPDGEVRWMRVRVRSHSGDGDAPDQLNGIFVDITEQKAIEAEAAVQRQEVTHLMRVSVLGELSGAIAHEINQPLTAILSNAQTALYLLEKDSPDLVEVREALKDIVDEDNRAGEVIQRLRRLLKKGEKSFETIDMNTLVASTILLLNSEMIARRVSVKTELADSLPTIFGDPVQLQQILLNLLMNAMDAMAATPAAERVITILTRSAHIGTVEALVRDRGTGIRAEDQRRLFEPFYTTKDRGLGLGLTICSTILQAHGGRLSLTNDPAGGAVAVLTLPAQEMLIAAQ